ncbi:hypothetical protein GGR53DRAFT_314775 [Hypoxylon sp. FL1150]|nr:hypothetical protein GGR53DRAFT_314775 [Hypoxylon sp. FL1150]
MFLMSLPALMLNLTNSAILVFCLQFTNAWFQNKLSPVLRSSNRHLHSLYHRELRRTLLGGLGPLSPFFLPSIKSQNLAQENGAALPAALYTALKRPTAQRGGGLRQPIIDHQRPAHVDDNNELSGPPQVHAAKIYYAWAGGGTPVGEVLLTLGVRLSSHPPPRWGDPRHSREVSDTVTVSDLRLRQCFSGKRDSVAELDHQTQQLLQESQPSTPPHQSLLVLRTGCSIRCGGVEDASPAPS